MTAVIVFLIVGGIAILSAAFMLISQNAVHSAMFLVLNFVCVAFFFLTLGAPFIALVQIAVYAGAIMVLFLFVIMMLGAERIEPGPGPYRWLPRAALILALIFLVTAGAAIAGGEINLMAGAPVLPQVRVIHAADAPPVDIYLANQLFVADVDFREATEYSRLEPGEYSISGFPAGADPNVDSPAMLDNLILTEGDVVSLVVLGANGNFPVVQLHENLAPSQDDVPRLTLLHGLPAFDEETIKLVDPGLESVEDDSTVLIDNAGYGEPVETLLWDRDAPVNVQVFVGGDEAPVLVYRGLELEAGTNNLLIPAPEALASGETRVVPLRFEAAMLPLYGSPQQVGGALFTTYLLPFELVAILLLVAMVGAIVLTHREMQAEHSPRRRIVRRPLVGPQAAAAQVSDMGAGDATAVDSAVSEPGK